MIDYSRVRVDIREAVLRYINDGWQPGGFLTAVLSNNLRDAFGRADAENFATLGDLVGWLYNHAPSPCWGSPEKVAAWLAQEPSYVAGGMPVITWDGV